MVIGGVVIALAMIIAFLMWRRKRSRYNAAAASEKEEQGVEAVPYSPERSTLSDSKRNPFGGFNRGGREAASESARTITHTEATALDNDSPQQETIVREVDGGVRLFPLSSEDDDEEPTNVRILPPVYSQYGQS